MLTKSNQFPGKCVYCHGIVPSGKGIIQGRKKSGKGWKISHMHDCLSGEEPLKNEPPSDYGDWQSPAAEGDIDKDYHG